MARIAKAGLGMARQGEAGKARLGGVWFDPARQGAAWQARYGMARQVAARHGKVRLPLRGGPTPIVVIREKICRIGNIGAAQSSYG